jgi:diaminopimelate epimerase
MSKKLNFSKMNGAGNDFVVFDNRDLKWDLSKEQIAKLCHRQFGVGADGMLIVEPAKQPADFRMRYYNADGGEAEMCGNGARCFARYVRPLKGADAVAVHFQTQAGLIQAEYRGEDVAIELTSPQGLKIGEELKLKETSLTVHSLNTGVPHAVIFVDDLEKTPVFDWGRELRYHSHFSPKGTNVNFVQILGKNEIRVRTYERGVEGETLACGTGVTASAILANLVHGVEKPVKIKVQSGDWLGVNFEKSGETLSKVELQGPAVIVFQGEIEV